MAYFEDSLMNMFSIPSRWKHDFARLVRNFKYDFDDNNDLLIANVKFDNYLDVYAPDGLGWQRSKNLVTTEGKNSVLDVVLHGTSAVATWYVAPSSGNVEPSATWTHSGATAYHTVATELLAGTDYNESTRVAFVEAAASAGSITNTASPATFTAKIDNVTIRGCGLCSTSVSQSTSASYALLAASTYTTARVLATIGDTLGVKWTINL